MPETLYKVLSPDGRCVHGGAGKWSLPSNDLKGEWMPAVEGELEACANGYHLVTLEQLIPWLRYGTAVFTVEARGDLLTTYNKLVAREARLLQKTPLDDRALRLWAADCAEHVLPLFEKKRPGDERPREAIEAARERANHPRSKKAAYAAAAAAAAAAADDAAADAYAADAAAADAAAAAAAAYAAAADDAAYAAAAAADDAAADADARWSARSAARATERAWQVDRLELYLKGRGPGQ